MLFEDREYVKGFVPSATHPAVGKNYPKPDTDAFHLHAYRRKQWRHITAKHSLKLAKLAADWLLSEEDTAYRIVNSESGEVVSRVTIHREWRPSDSRKNTQLA